MRTLTTFRRALVATTLLASGAAAVPEAHAAAAPAIGSSTAVSFYLPLTDEAAAEASARAIATPGSASYRHFLSRAAFVSRFAASDATIRQVEAVLSQLGYTVTTVFANHLAIQATAPTTTVEATLGVTLRPAIVGHRLGVVPSARPRVPAALAGLVRGVGGLDTVHAAHPLRVHAPNARPAYPAPATMLTGGVPGSYLPADYAARYDVDPLYRGGLTGRGSTIGIVTLANFHPSDAYIFWHDIGLSVSQNRITTVDVDGGTAVAPSDAAGEGETDIDVEESGALAPGANVRVYVAPNGPNSEFIDAFEAAASDDIADTLSTSWGEAEVDYFAEPAIGQPDQTDQLQDFHDVFLELALQGQTLFAAAGDSGSFDTVDECAVYGTPSPTTPICNAPYEVDAPANDPLVTAAGGTTTPFDQVFTGVTLTVPVERVWGWDYLVTEAAAQGKASVLTLADEFSTGGGGGVSSYWPKPGYQDGVAGITKTVPGQIYTQNVGAGPVTLYSFPSGYAGRNVPDLSTDADPFSGYQYIEEKAVQSGWGGTSFVGPQLNGVTALLVQGLGGRVGQLNPSLYALGNLTTNDITAGDNWGYDGKKGYDNGTGIGTLDASKLLIGLGVLGLGL